MSGLEIQVAAERVSELIQKHWHAVFEFRLVGDGIDRVETFALHRVMISWRLLEMNS